MLGSDLASVLSEQDLIVADRPEWDITKNEELKVKIQNCQPELIINCAAFTDVEAAEEQSETVFKVNAQGSLNLARISSELNLPLMQISTDYVFDGEKGSGYNEDDKTQAISVYGRSKEQGEKNIINNCQKYYIIRTSWLFGRAVARGKKNKTNFVDKMLELSQTQKVIKAVSDQFSKPTYAKDLARSIKSNFIDNQREFGIYHLVNEGAVSWFDYAEEIFKQRKIKIKLQKISGHDFFQKARRPKYSALNNNKLPKLRPWPEALADYLKSIQIIK